MLPAAGPASPRHLFSPLKVIKVPQWMSHTLGGSKPFCKRRSHWEKGPEGKGEIQGKVQTFPATVVPDFSILVGFLWPHHTVGEGCLCREEKGSFCLGLPWALMNTCSRAGLDTEPGLTNHLLPKPWPKPRLGRLKRSCRLAKCGGPRAVPTSNTDRGEKCIPRSLPQHRLCWKTS